MKTNLELFNLQASLKVDHLEIELDKPNIEVFFLFSDVTKISFLSVKSKTSNGGGSSASEAIVDKESEK